MSDAVEKAKRDEQNERLIRASWKAGYAAAREQAAEAVRNVKRIYVDASNANTAGPLLDEAVASIRAMEAQDE